MNWLLIIASDENVRRNFGAPRSTRSEPVRHLVKTNWKPLYTQKAIHAAIRLLPSNFLHACADGENKWKQWYCVFLFTCFFSPLPGIAVWWLIISAALHARRWIIRTDRANRWQGQSAFTVWRQNQDFFFFSAHVLAADLRWWLITDCSLKSEFLIGV